MILEDADSSNIDAGKRFKQQDWTPPILTDM